MLVSIIIPIYNVAPYIEQCLQSVFNQTYKGGIELILVDDCGTDDSLVLAETFCKQQQRADINVYFIYQSYNQGQSAARNAGLKVASGECVYFLDSDDYLSVDCIDKLVRAIESSAGVQMALGNYSYTVGGLYSLLRLSTGNYQATDMLDFVLDGSIATTPTNKLIRTAFLREHKLFFKEGLFHEDFLWFFCVACHLTKIAVVDEPTYTYVIREGSTERNPDWCFHRRNYFKALMEIKKYYILGRFQKKAEVIRWIQHKETIWFLETLWYNYPDLAHECYQLVRKYPTWSFPKLILNGSFVLLQQVSKYFPYRFGFKIYSKLSTEIHKL